MTFGSLRLRLLIGAAGFIVAALAISAIGLTFLFRQHVERWVDGELAAHLDQLTAGIDVEPGGKLVVMRPPTDPRFQLPMSGRYWEVIVSPDGPVLRSRSLWDYEIPLAAEEGVGDSLHHYRLPGPAGTSIYLVHAALRCRLASLAEPRAWPSQSTTPKSPARAWIRQGQERGWDSRS